MATAKQYTLSIEITIPEDVFFPSEILESVNDAEALCYALMALADNTTVADDILKVSGTLHGPELVSI